MRLIFAPQYPAKLRYQEWFLNKFKEVFDEHFDEVIMLGCVDSSSPTRAESKDFSPLIESCKWEYLQIEQYLSLELREGDILLLMDLSFPGFFPQVLYHKRPSKVFGFFHATSKNRYDYFNNETQYEKFQTEGALASVCDNVFVGSYYHKRKLLWENIIVTYLPYPSFHLDPPENRDFRNVVSVARNSKQKRDIEKETYLEKKLGFVIERPDAKDWNSYYRFLQESKVMIITSREETFGYQVVDAVLNHCIPIAPNAFSYPELLPQEYLYNPLNREDMVEKVNYALKDQLCVPKLLCDWDMRSFYRNIIEIMKG